MRISKVHIKSSWIKVIITTIIIFIFLFVFLIFREYIQFTQNISFFEDKFLNERESVLQREIYNRIDEITYELSALEANAIMELKDKIGHIENVLINSVKNTQEKSIGQMSENMVHIVLDHAHLDPEYLYFMIDMEGNVILSGTDSNINGINLYDIKDKEGKFFIREMIEDVKDDGEAIVSYYWPKVKDGEPLYKTSYCKYINKIDAIIGTGVYFDDLNKLLQDRIFEKLQAYYEGKQDYVFVTGYDGVARTSGNKELVGKDLTQFKDVDGKIIHEKFMDIVNSTGEGFLTYTFFERNSDMKSKKISFIKSIPEWKVYIGIGLYLNDFNESIEIFKNKYKNDMLKQIVTLLVFFVLLSGILIYFITNTIDMIKIHFKQEEMLYEKFSDLTLEGIVIIDINNIIQFANPVAKKLLQIAKEDFGKLKIDSLIVEDNEKTLAKGLYGLHTTIEKYDEQIFYMEKDYKVIFFKDISEKLAYEEQLKFIADTDQLTAIPNRRRFINDYEALVSAKKHHSTSFCMSMIDLDRFKAINDLFGHNMGDNVLKTFASEFKTHISEDDTLYRYGGEEFMAIFVNIDMESCKNLLNKINESLSNYDWKTECLKVTFTAGLIEVKGDNIQNLDAYLKRLDELLYQGKQNGRNQVVC